MTIEELKQKTLLSSSDIKKKLASRYSYDKGFVFLEEISTYGVGDQKGNNRRVDCMFISTFPSMGHYKAGIEIKISRSDLMNEFKDPSKSNAIFEYFDYFYLAIPDKKIIAGIQLPEHWGVILVTERGCRQIKNAVRNEEAKCDNSFLSRVCQKFMVNYVSAYTHHEIIKEYQNKIDEKAKQLNESNFRNAEYYKRQYEELYETVKTFEDKSGISIKYARTEYLLRLAGVIKMLMNNDGKIIDEYRISSLIDVRDNIDKLVESIRVIQPEQEKESRHK